MSDRRTGRTTAQLVALPDGGVFLVHSRDHVDYCRHLLRKAGRCPNTAIRFATKDSYRHFIGARFEHFDIDHAYFELTGRRGTEAYDFLSLCLYPR